MADHGKPISKLRPILHATVFAVGVVGALSAGLGVTTYTVAKANEAVFGDVMLSPSAVDRVRQCPAK